jgi:hypothetical protein
VKDQNSETQSGQPPRKRGPFEINVWVVEPIEPGFSFTQITGGE